MLSFSMVNFDKDKDFNKFPISTLPRGVEAVEMWKWEIGRIL